MIRYLVPKGFARKFVFPYFTSQNLSSGGHRTINKRRKSTRFEILTSSGRWNRTTFSKPEAVVIIKSLKPQTPVGVQPSSPRHSYRYSRHAAHRAGDEEVLARRLFALCSLDCGARGGVLSAEGADAGL